MDTRQQLGWYFSVAQTQFVCQRYWYTAFLPRWETKEGLSHLVQLAVGSHGGSQTEAILAYRAYLDSL